MECELPHSTQPLIDGASTESGALGGRKGSGLEPKGWVGAIGACGHYGSVSRPRVALWWPQLVEFTLCVGVVRRRLSVRRSAQRQLTAQPRGLSSASV